MALDSAWREDVLGSALAGMAHGQLALAFRRWWAEAGEQAIWGGLLMAAARLQLSIAFEMWRAEVERCRTTCSMRSKLSPVVRVLVEEEGMADAMEGCHHPLRGPAPDPALGPKDAAISEDQSSTALAWNHGRAGLTGILRASCLTLALCLRWPLPRSSMAGR
jgi:hypothetical protein